MQHSWVCFLYANGWYVFKVKDYFFLSLQIPLFYVLLLHLHEIKTLNFVRKQIYAVSKLHLENCKITILSN